jgi:hypothetical protein
VLSWARPGSNVVDAGVGAVGQGLFLALSPWLELARDVVEAEREVVPKEEINRGKAALTELFESVKTEETPIVVERVVDDTTRSPRRTL